MIKIEKIDGDTATIAFDNITMDVNCASIPENAIEGAELSFIISSQSEPVEIVEEATELEEVNPCPCNTEEN